MEKAVLKNIVINFAGLVAPTIVSLVTVPAYIRMLGVERYGVINLVWVFIGYFGLLDFGTSLATENQIAKARDKSHEEVERIFSGALFLNLCTGIAGGLLVYLGASLYLEWGVHAAPELKQEVTAALPWLALAIPIANISWVFAGAITGVERFASYNTNQTLGTFLFQLLPLAAIYCFSPSLAVAIPAAVVARLFAGILLGVATFRALGVRRMRLPERHVIAAIFGYGKWALLFAGAGGIAGALDRVLLGAILGARAVTCYSAPQNLVTRLNMLPSAMLRTLFPRLSTASHDEARELARSALALLNGLFTPCMIVALFALKPFLNLWVGAEIAEAAAPVGRVLVLSVWLSGQSSILGILIQARANPASVAWISWLQLPFFGAALWGATHAFGVLGTGTVVVAKAACDYAAYLYFASVDRRGVVVNMLGHAGFLLAAFGVADLPLTLVVAAAAALILCAANFALSLHQSAELREIARKYRYRFGLSIRSN